MGHHSAGENRTPPRRTPSPPASHRAPPQGSGPLAYLTHLLGKTVPKRVPPPRFYRVLFVSGVSVALALFGYSSTQVYLHFSDPQDEAAGDGGADAVPPEALPPEPMPDSEGQDGVEVSPDHAASGDSPMSAEVGYVVEEETAEEFTGEVTISNVGDVSMDDWDLELTFEEAEVLVVWGAEWEPKADGARISPGGASAAIAPGASETISFQAEGATEIPRCRLNGHNCGLSD